MFRAPTEKHSQIIATFGDTIPKTSETVVLVGKSPKQKLKNQELQKRNYSSSIWMCMNKVRYATSYQIHSTLLLIPSYTSYTSPLKKGIKSIAPFSFFVPTKNHRKPRPNPPGCWWQSHPPYLANHGKRLRKTDLLKFKRTKVPVRVKRFLLQREVSNSSRNFYGKGL